MVTMQDDQKRDAALQFVQGVIVRAAQKYICGDEPPLSWEWPVNLGFPTIPKPVEACCRNRQCAEAKQDLHGFLQSKQMFNVFAEYARVPVSILCLVISCLCAPPVRIPTPTSVGRGAANSRHLPKQQ